MALYASFMKIVAMKGTVEVWSRSFAKELGGRRLAVNVVAPGAIETEFGGGAVRDPKQINAKITARLAKRFARFAIRFLPVVLLLAASSGCLTHPGRIKWDGEANLLRLRTDSATFALNSKGSICTIAPVDSGVNYIPAGQPAPILQLKIAGVVHVPDRASWDAKSGRLKLEFLAAGATAVLKVESKPTHLVFEVIEVQSPQPVELVLWGPYPTTIGDIIGEVVGVVRNPDFAIGIQALNPKTLGGSPTHENDTENGYDAEDSGHYPNLAPELNQQQSFRGDTARRTAFGSVLQGYCRNRDRERLIANWGQDQYLAPAWHDGGVIGSKLALFACPASRALATLGAIEVAEGLPHPELDGVWAKQSPAATTAYLISDFGENTIDRAIEMTRRAGLHYLYHSSPFETWGHFQLKADFFPHGVAGLRACVDKANQAGIRVGFHTLSNFITPNDPYVTPNPDPRLAQVGASPLMADIDVAQTEIPVAAPEYFRKTTAMNTVRIDGELVHYESVSAEAPWRLLKCQRGAWKTVPAPHAKNAAVAKLADHDYKVFLTNPELTREVGENLARLCNTAGTRQLSLDGVEGTFATGLGQYGRALFTASWYDSLQPGLRGTINDASNPGHFTWHIATRMNWGEPWYAGFRESQTLYRFKNQLFFERNLLPHMLGWFSLSPKTTVADTEWMLARAAGYDAGFALCASLASTAQLTADPNSTETLKRFGSSPAILEAVRQWETARAANAFTADVKARLRDNQREFHLEPAGVNQWDLYEVKDGQRGTPTRVVGGR